MFGASRFQIPEPSKINDEITELQEGIKEQRSYLRNTEAQIRSFIKDVIYLDNEPTKFELYKLYFRKEKMIYSNLNKCRVIGNFIDGEVWIPIKNYDEVLESMDKLSREDEHSAIATFTDLPISSKDKPPTYIKTNEFTWVFQEIVDTYGVPRYGEANPALFTIISFPFLFGVMFGDIGHGFLLFLLGSYLVLYDREIRKDPSMELFSKTRFLLFFMGLFAFYNGWMYNDFLSIPLNIFGSCYENVYI